MPTSNSVLTALAVDLPVLFVLIGWTREYRGVEAVVGGHDWLKRHPTDNWESRAFLASDGLYSCGIGHGKVSCQQLHVVFVARDPEGVRRVVGVYARADVDETDGYPRASTKHALLIEPSARPKLASWPGDQGVRRWALRPSRGEAHRSLYLWFLQFRRRPLGAKPFDLARSEDQTYLDLAVTEGSVRISLTKHRRREARLRDAKVRSVLQERGVDGLTCEVPGCGFNFARQYGPLGARYVHVHHLVPLSRVGARGQRVRMSDLAIVCANCHAMIHIGGECRPLHAIRPRIDYASL